MPNMVFSEGSEAAYVAGLLAKARAAVDEAFMLVADVDDHFDGLGDRRRNEWPDPIGIEDALQLLGMAALVRKDVGSIVEAAERMVSRAIVVAEVAEQVAEAAGVAS